MPIIYYQSLNSTSSAISTLKSAVGRYFTRMNHSHSQGSFVLEPPRGSASTINSSKVISGPLNKVIIGNDDFYSVPRNQFECTDHQLRESILASLFSQNLQFIKRNFQGRPGLMAIGELNAEAKEWEFLEAFIGQRVSNCTTGKACNSFTIYDPTKSSEASNFSVAGKGGGWIVVRYEGLTIAFVHVPNSIANNEPKLIAFYNEINRAFFGPTIDIIMGDTNQTTESRSLTAINEVFEGTYVYATPANIEPLDTLGEHFGGTNATGSQLYDVAIYNSDLLDEVKGEYLSQRTVISLFNTEEKVWDKVALAATDHMGMVVEFRKKPIHFPPSPAGGKGKGALF